MRSLFDAEKRPWQFEGFENQSCSLGTLIYGSDWVKRDKTQGWAFLGLLTVSYIPATRLQGQLLM